ncbi:MAG: hypothetical protein JSU03_11490 [Bacteroidetes bacterium]|nr:hypothetical protein [Bacteroidota bacterium]
MEAASLQTASKLLAQQTTINTTSWVGHINDNKEIATGQTFMATTDGDVKSVEIYSNMVSKPGHVTMSLHAYDPQQKEWGHTIQSTNIEVKKNDTGKWVKFAVPGMHVDKGKIYGFKIESQDCFMGLGEAAGSSKLPPFTQGQEWKFVNNNAKIDSYNYFCLAFKIGMVG